MGAEGETIVICQPRMVCYVIFFFQAEDGIRDLTVTGVQTCALPIFVGLFLGLLEDFADLALGFADVLVEELGALDVEEVALDFLAALFGDLLGEVVGDGLGDHGFAAAWGAVEEDALGRRELVLLIVVGVEVGELDGVFDGLDLVGEAADIVVADVWHFFRAAVLDVSLWG